MARLDFPGLAFAASPIRRQSGLTRDLSGKALGEVNRVAQELTNRDRLCCCRIWPALVAFGVLRHRTSHERTSEYRAASFPLPFLNCGDRPGACVLDRGSYRMARYQRDECCSLRSTRICYLGSCQPVEIKLTQYPISSSGLLSFQTWHILESEELGTAEGGKSGVKRGELWRDTALGSLS